MPSSRPETLDRPSSVRRVLIRLLVANLAVVVAKLAVGIAANSLAVLGGALDSAVDALNNALGMVLVRVAAKAPDDDHPYGHDKFEWLGTLAIVGFLSVSCFELVRGAVDHLLSGGHPVAVSDFQLAVLVVTMGVSVVVARYEHRRGSELGSRLLVADARHTRADALVTVVAIAVAVLIVRVAYSIVSQAVPVLVDERALPPGAIRDSAEAVTGVKGAYGIRSRGAPPVRYAEVTIAVDRGANVADAHAIADEVEERLKHDLQLHEVIVHVEPC